MALYSRQQLLVLLALVASLGGGLAVERWRRAHPEMAERIERFDRAGSPETAAGPAGRQGGRALRSPKLRPDSSLAGISPIDLNRATVEELTRLPGVGPALAERIIEARHAEPFRSVEDLRRVLGFGESKLERVRPLVTVSPP